MPFDEMLLNVPPSMMTFAMLAPRFCVSWKITPWMALAMSTSSKVRPSMSLAALSLLTPSTTLVMTRRSSETSDSDAWSESTTPWWKPSISSPAMRTPADATVIAAPELESIPAGCVVSAQSAKFWPPSTPLSESREPSILAPLMPTMEIASWTVKPPA